MLSKFSRRFVFDGLKIKLYKDIRVENVFFLKNALDLKIL